MIQLIWLTLKDKIVLWLALVGYCNVAQSHCNHCSFFYFINSLSLQFQNFVDCCQVELQHMYSQLTEFVPMHAIEPLLCTHDSFQLVPAITLKQNSRNWISVSILEQSVRLT